MNQINDQLPVGLLAQFVRVLHCYHRGQGFESRKAGLFSVFLFLSCVFNCDELLHIFEFRYLIWHSYSCQLVFCKECKEPFQQGHSCRQNQSASAATARQSVSQVHSLLFWLDSFTALFSWAAGGFCLSSAQMIGRAARRMRRKLRCYSFFCEACVFVAFPPSLNKPAQTTVFQMCEQQRIESWFPCKIVSSYLHVHRRLLL